MSAPATVKAQTSRKRGYAADTAESRHTFVDGLRDLGTHIVIDDGDENDRLVQQHEWLELGDEYRKGLPAPPAVAEFARTSPFHDVPKKVGDEVLAHAPGDVDLQQLLTGSRGGDAETIRRTDILRFRGHHRCIVQVYRPTPGGLRLHTTWPLDLTLVVAFLDDSHPNISLYFDFFEAVHLYLTTP